MTRAIIISSTPMMCKKIADGECTILVRKTRPKLETPFRCFLYCTNSPGTLFVAYDGLHYSADSVGKSDPACANGKVIGEFICDQIVDGKAGPQEWEYICENSKLSCKEIYDYCGTDKEGEVKYCYGWHISNLVIYDKPKSLEMYPTGKIARDCGCGGYIVYDKILTRPPRGWCYTRDKEN